MNGHDAAGRRRRHSLPSLRAQRNNPGAFRRGTLDCFAALAMTEQGARARAANDHLAAHLTKTGMFVRRRYNERRPRYEYVLTDKARDFFPVIATLLAWGNKHLAPKGEAILLANRDDRRPLDPVVVNAANMQPITLGN